MSDLATPGGLERRGLFALIASAAACVGWPRRAPADEQAHLLVAGAYGGRLARWAAILAPALQRGWPDGSIDVRTSGGEDGVTGANQFEARDPSDGTALLLPGAAAAAWLAGDPRVHFDAARWLPVLCGVSGGVLVGRQPLAAARPNRPLRVAVPDPLGPAAACLLGLDLLRVPARPVTVVPSGTEPLAALRGGRADAVFLASPDALPQAAALRALPLFTLGLPENERQAARDPAMNRVPALPELLASAAPSDPALLEGWQAVAAATQLNYAVVLPSLSAAPSVALWRQAADHAAFDPALRDAAGAVMRTAVRTLAMPGCGLVLGAIATRSAALLAYRRWLALRLGYQPG